MASSPDLSYEVLSDVHIGCHPFRNSCTTYFCIHQPHHPCPHLSRIHSLQHEPSACVSPPDPPIEQASAATLDQDSDLVVRRRRKLPSTREADTRPCSDVITIHHSLQTVLNDVGLQVWRGALLLADFILQRISTDSNAFWDTIAIELGAGTGLAGIVMARAARLVFLTDRGDDVLHNCQRNAIANARAFAYGEGAVRVRHLDWNRPWPPAGTCSLPAGTCSLPGGTCSLPDRSSEGANGDVDGVYGWTDADVADAELASVLLASDVVYMEALTDAFFDTVRRLMPVGSRKVLYVALEKRYNFALDEREVVATGYRHFRTHFRSPTPVEDRNGKSSGVGFIGLTLRSRELEEEDLVGSLIDTTCIPQRLHRYERGKNLEIWEIKRASGMAEEGKDQ